MNYEHLKKTEIDVLKKTEDERKYFFDKVPDLIDSLFEANYFIAWNIEGSDEQNYQVFANQIYLSLPYNMRCIEIVLKRGYYLESDIIIRTLFEMFAKLRYFFNHQEDCLPYAMGNKKNITYKVMLEELSPGLYEKLYFLLSEFSHGGFGISMFHNKVTPPNNFQPIVGQFYDEMLSNLPIYSSIQLFYGYLNYLPILFNKYKETVPPEINQRRLENLNWIDERINEHIKKYPNVKDFYSLLNPLIR